MAGVMKSIGAIVLLMLAVALPVSGQSASAEPGGIKSWWNNLVNGNVDRTFERPVDLSFALAPSYTREGGVGIGGMATALYRTDRTDSLMSPSDVTLAGNMSIGGFYAIAVRGRNNFRGDKTSVVYNAAFMHKTLDFWGISFKGCSRNPVTEYVKQLVNIECEYVYKPLPNLYVGGLLNVLLATASNADSLYLEGQSPRCNVAGVGVTVAYDSRDFRLNPKRGVYAYLRGVAYPGALASGGRSVYSLGAVFDAYLRGWRGSVIAIDLYGELNSSDSPWAMREELGSGGARMRGYYSGRYVDNCQVASQVELRQHIRGRVGCVAWAGCGTVFSSPRSLADSKLLSNYGLGLRVEFKHNVNIRVDYGFGKQTSGLVFQVAEAF